VSDRRSIEIEGLSHLTAIPVATRIGPLITSSVIVAFDPGTRDVPENSGAQLDNLFRHMKLILDEAGASWDDVAKVEFWAPTAEMRNEIDGHYVEVFPDESSRPSRHTHTSDGTVMTASFIAYVND
jgi:enamine deaminase RidA (YjgF/YER057c/UK114 family)